MHSWEIKEANRVLCAILSVEQVTMHWAQGFRRLIIPGPDPITISGLPFDHARNVACQECLNRGCEYLFFLDSDVVPPPDAVLRLLNHRKPIISGMYCRRSPPHAVPVMMRDHQWVTEIPNLHANENPVIEVELVGAGCMLIHRSLLQAMLKVQPPQRPGKPWFDWRSDLQGVIPPGEAMSEDFTFCKAIRERLGVPVLVDTSIRCFHVGLAEANYGTFYPPGATPAA